jgi:hypothetical protein
MGYCDCRHDSHSVEHRGEEISIPSGVLVFLSDNKEISPSWRIMVIGGDNMNFDPMATTNRLANELWQQQQERFKNIAEGNKRKEEREEEKIQLLRDIKESNFQMVELIRRNNEINKDLFDLFQELNTIMVANNEEEAKGILTKVLEKAVSLNDGYGALSSLAAHGEVLYQFVKMKYFN